MNVDACSKCQDLYDRAAAADDHCPRCVAIAELLAAADALNAKVKTELEKTGRLLVAVVRKADFAPLVERAGRAIEKARTL